MDYINIPIENDGEYIISQRARKTSLTLVVLFFGASVVVAAVFIVKTKKNMKLNELEKEQQASQIEHVQEVKRCKYCGSKQNPDDTKCPNCGASFVD